LLTDVGLLEARKDLWLDHLYVRISITDESSKGDYIDWASYLNCYGKDCNLWLTSVTLQGILTDLVTYNAMDVSGGQVYASGAVALHPLHPMTFLSYAFDCMESLLKQHLEELLFELATLLNRLNIVA
jgi:hypothetical protein